ncbi:MAG: hypothetical protein DCC68_25875 [Planctomycetota bacterium]|nr:MAG: hypothetical protein DCC68_25875 [Planctomycetota bacterium]
MNFVKLRSSRFIRLTVVLGAVAASVGGGSYAIADEEDKDARITEARTSFAAAMRERMPDARRAALAEAAKSFDACLELKFIDEIERHRVMREAGTAHLELAKSLWPLEQWNHRYGEDTGIYRPAEAAKHYRRASELFGAVSAYWVEKVGKLPKTPDEARSKLIAAGLGFAEMMAADSDLGASWCGLAGSLPTTDDGKKQAVAQAIETCKRVHDDYPFLAIGAYAGIRGAGVLHSTGDVERALAICEEVNGGIDNILSASQRTVSDLRARVCHQLMLCWRDKKIAKPERAIEIGEDWLAAEDEEEKTKAAWEPQIRAQLAYAYFVRWASSTDRESQENDETAARKHILWLEERKLVHPLARMALQAFERGPRASDK